MGWWCEMRRLLLILFIAMIDQLMMLDPMLMWQFVSLDCLTALVTEVTALFCVSACKLACMLFVCVCSRAGAM